MYAWTLKIPLGITTPIFSIDFAKLSLFFWLKSIRFSPNLFINWADNPLESTAKFITVEFKELSFLVIATEADIVIVGNTETTFIGVSASSKANSNEVPFNNPIFLAWERT